METELVHPIFIEVCKSIASILYIVFQYKGDIIFQSCQEKKNFEIIPFGGKGFIIVI